MGGAPLVTIPRQEFAIIKTPINLQSTGFMTWNLVKGACMFDGDTSGRNPVITDCFIRDNVLMGTFKINKKDYQLQAKMISYGLRTYDDPKSAGVNSDPNTIHKSLNFDLTSTPITTAHINGYKRLEENPYFDIIYGMGTLQNGGFKINFKIDIENIDSHIMYSRIVIYIDGCSKSVSNHLEFRNQGPGFIYDQQRMPMLSNLDIRDLQTTLSKAANLNCYQSDPSRTSVCAIPSNANGKLGSYAKDTQALQSTINIQEHTLRDIAAKQQDASAKLQTCALKQDAQSQDLEKCRETNNQLNTQIETLLQQQTKIVGDLLNIQFTITATQKQLDAATLQQVADSNALATVTASIKSLNDNIASYKSQQIKTQASIEEQQQLLQEVQKNTVIIQEFLQLKLSKEQISQGIQDFERSIAATDIQIKESQITADAIKRDIAKLSEQQNQDTSAIQSAQNQIKTLQLQLADQIQTVTTLQQHTINQLIYPFAKENSHFFLFILLIAAMVIVALTIKSHKDLSLIKKHPRLANAPIH